MQIISTTQTQNSEHLIGDALRSVLPFVDACLVCVSAGLTDRTLEIAREVAGDKLIERSFDWGDDFSTARNFHLQEAHRLGFDWSVTLDTDERLVNLQRGDFDTLNADVLFVNAMDGSYKKQRAFRLPCIGRWEGAVHEAFLTMGAAQETVPNAHFWEVLKTPEQQQAKFRRIVEILGSPQNRARNDPRSWYYLGDAYAGVGAGALAIHAFHKCTDCDGWNEEGAWAMYRAADLHVQAMQYDKALKCIAKGLTKHSGMAELYWMAGLACYWMGQSNMGVFWSINAIMLGKYHGIGKEIQRIGFNCPKGLYEGPFEVLNHCYRALGQQDLAEQAQNNFDLAVAARHAICK